MGGCVILYNDGFVICLICHIRAHVLVLERRGEAEPLSRFLTGAVVSPLSGLLWIMIWIG